MRTKSADNSGALAFEELRESGKWSEEQLFLGIRANFRCEYCDRDLMASVDDYWSWQVDHVWPTSKAGEFPGDIQSPANKAIACRTCNAIKRNRTLDMSPASGRGEMIKRWREEIARWRADKLQEVARTRLLAFEMLRNAPAEYASWLQRQESSGRSAKPR